MGQSRFFWIKICALSRATTLAGCARRLILPSRGVVFYAGNATAEVFVINKGIVRLYHAIESGREVTVKHVGPQNMLGEKEALGGHGEHLESAQTLTTVELIALDGNAFRRFVDEDANVSRVLLRNICSRLCATARTETAAFFNIETRLAGVLLAYLELFGAPDIEGIRINHPLTLLVLGNCLGVSTKSVSRTLAKWHLSGIVVRNEGQLVVRDISALQQNAKDYRCNLNERLKSVA